MGMLYCTFQFTFLFTSTTVSMKFTFRQPTAIHLQVICTFFICCCISNRAGGTLTNFVSCKHSDVICPPRMEALKRSTCEWTRYYAGTTRQSLTCSTCKGLIIYTDLHGVVNNVTVAMKASCPWDTHHSWSLRDNLQICGWVWYHCWVQLNIISINWPQTFMSVNWYGDCLVN